MQLTSTAATLAAQNLGLVRRRDLLEAGIGVAAIDHAVRSGRLHAMARGVYRIPGVPVGPLLSMAAVIDSLACPALFSHRSAAWLWGLIDHAPRRHEISVPRGVRVTRPGFDFRESRDLDRASPGDCQGLPVTGVGRTILDCATHADIDLQLLVDNARRTYRISRSLLPSVLADHARPGRPGVTRLRALLLLDELPHSDFERLAMRWLRARGLGGWMLHHRIVVERFGPIEIDLAWPDAMVAVELEGGDHRDRALVHDHDTARQNALLAAGWRVIRITYRRWLTEPDAVLGEIQAALALAPTVMP